MGTYSDLINKGDMVHFYMDGHECIGIVVGFKPDDIVVVEYREICYDKLAENLMVL